jgi:hypothetical protein
MPPRSREGRPTKGPAPEIAATASESSLLETVDSLDAIAHHVDGAFVVVVEATGGKYKRRCYLTAKAAENAAGRATLRGENATVYLAELKPLWKLRGGDAG